MGAIDIAVLVFVVVGIAAYIKSRKPASPPREGPKGVPNPGAEEDR